MGDDSLLLQMASTTMQLDLTSVEAVNPLSFAAFHLELTVGLRLELSQETMMA